MIQNFKILSRFFLQNSKINCIKIDFRNLNNEIIPNKNYLYGLYHNKSSAYGDV